MRPLPDRADDHRWLGLSRTDRRARDRRSDAGPAGSGRYCTEPMITDHWGPVGTDRRARDRRSGAGSAGCGRFRTEPTIMGSSGSRPGRERSTPGRDATATSIARSRSRPGGPRRGRATAAPRRASHLRGPLRRWVPWAQRDGVGGRAGCCSWRSARPRAPRSRGRRPRCRWSPRSRPGRSAPCPSTTSWRRRWGRGCCGSSTGSPAPTTAPTRCARCSRAPPGWIPTCARPGRPARGCGRR